MRRFGAAAAAILASGCATVPPPDVAGDWATARAELQALDDWMLDGRAAVAAGNQGFSGGLRWQQRGAHSEIELRAPMGGAAIRIMVDGVDYVVIDERGTRHGGEDARRVLAESLAPGAPLPIAEMRYWLVGAPAPGTPHDAVIGDDGRPAILQQSGWQVRYGRYQAVGNMALPVRIEMTAEGTRLRVIVAGWRLGS